MIVKLVSALDHGRIRETWFTGPDEHTLTKVGELLLDLGEWQLIGAAMLMGADPLSRHLKVITEGDGAVTAAFADPPF